ncbi:MAG: prepilin-type N-terminal cleavage/methylation domain-containing protein, partial [Prochlorococcaceae cyanobacterium]
MSRTCRIRTPAGRPAKAAGFSLLELLLAMGLGSMLAGALLQLLLADGQGMQRLGRLLRERSHQQRTLELLRGDVQRAEAISAQQELESHACSLAGRRPVLHLRLAQGAAVTYSVGAAPSGIWRGQVLMRCGPAFGLDGQPSLVGTPQNRVVLDGLARPQPLQASCGRASPSSTTRFWGVPTRLGWPSSPKAGPQRISTW